MQNKIESIHLLDNNGELVGVFSTVENKVAFSLKNPANTESLDFYFNNFGPYIKMKNPEILAFLSLTNHEFTISVFDTETQSAKASVSINKEGKFFITQYNEEGPFAKVSVEEYLRHLIREEILSQRV